MIYEMEGYIETIDSNGKFTFCGAEGYCLEKEKNTYNILWPKEKSDILVVRIPVKQKFSIRKKSPQKDLSLLISAKANYMKIKLVFDKDLEKNHLSLKSIILI